MTETELCQVFMDAAESYNWTCYPETSGWDILLVRDGVQVGVQAKLRANVKVIAQCLPEMFWFGRRLSASMRKRVVRRGPKYRTVLVPRSRTSAETIRDLGKVCQALGIWVLTDDRLGWQLLKTGLLLQEDYDWQPEEPEWIPEFVPLVAAGAKSPTQLTGWKQGALRLLARAKVRGVVTSQDAKELGVNFDLFVNRMDSDPWLLRKGRDGRRYTYEFAPASMCRPDSRRPDIIHPEAFEFYLKEQSNE